MSLETGASQTIEGRSLDDIKDVLFKKYGLDYNIENYKTILKSAGFFRPQREIVVATYSVKNQGSYTSPSPVKREPAPQEELEKNRQAILAAQNATLVSSAISEISKMSSKIEEVKSTIDSLKEKSTSSSELHPNIARIDELLCQNEFTPAYRKMIEEKIRSRFTVNQLEDFKLVERTVVDWIGETIEIAPVKAFRPPHVIIIVGPTGVGKTTTLAKLITREILSAKNQSRPRPEYVMMTTDTMKVGAKEQLEKFAEIFGKNVKEAKNAEDVQRIYMEYKEHVDFFFIDTSGYSPNDAENIGKMKTMLNVQMNSDIYLAVMASTAASSLQNIFRNYETFAYGSVIVTKWDEADLFGGVISVLWDRHKSISYITDGQKVHSFIHRANKVDILKQLKGFDIDRVHIEEKFGDN